VKVPGLGLFPLRFCDDTYWLPRGTLFLFTAELLVTPTPVRQTEAVRSYWNNDVTGHEPERKLRYDVEYIRRQSFRFDVAIVIRQLWQVAMDGWQLVRPGR
jgi:hypothetical protein